MRGRNKALRAFATAIGVTFNDVTLLGRALTHDSYLNEH
jgi:dsRNA-specific ribonuclease